MQNSYNQNFHEASQCGRIRANKFVKALQESILGDKREDSEIRTPYWKMDSTHYGNFNQVFSTIPRKHCKCCNVQPCLSSRTIATQTSRTVGVQTPIDDRIATRQSEHGTSPIRRSHVWKGDEVDLLEDDPIEFKREDPADIMWVAANPQQVPAYQTPESATTNSQSFVHRSVKESPESISVKTSPPQKHSLNTLFPKSEITFDDYLGQLEAQVMENHLMLQEKKLV